MGRQVKTGKLQGHVQMGCLEVLRVYTTHKWGNEMGQYDFLYNRFPLLMNDPN